MPYYPTDWAGPQVQRKVGEVPAFVHTLQAASGAPQRVEVTSLETEAFTPPSAFAAEVPDAFDFDYTVVRQPEGWLGKVSGPSVIRTAAGYERLLAVNLRLVPETWSYLRRRTLGRRFCDQFRTPGGRNLPLRYSYHGGV